MQYLSYHKPHGAQLVTRSSQIEHENFRKALLMIVISESFYQTFIIINLCNYLYEKRTNQYSPFQIHEWATNYEFKTFFSVTCKYCVCRKGCNDNKNDNQITGGYLIISNNFSCMSLLWWQQNFNFNFTEDLQKLQNLMSVGKCTMNIDIQHINLQKLVQTPKRFGVNQNTLVLQCHFIISYYCSVHLKNNLLLKAAFGNRENI